MAGGVKTFLELVAKVDAFTVLLVAPCNQWLSKCHFLYFFLCF
jgi:hypothetical protein